MFAVCVRIQLLPVTAKAVAQPSETSPSQPTHNGRLLGLGKRICRSGPRERGSAPAKQSGTRLMQSVRTVPLRPTTYSYDSTSLSKSTDELGLPSPIISLRTRCTTAVNKRRDELFCVNAVDKLQSSALSYISSNHFVASLK